MRIHVQSKAFRGMLLTACSLLFISSCAPANQQAGLSNLEHTNPGQTSTPTTLTAYVNSTDGISIKYPQSWSKLENPAPGVVVKFSSTSAIPFEFMITISDWDQSLENYTSAYLDNRKSRDKDLRILESLQTTMAGNQAWKIVYQTGYTKGMQVWTVKNNKMYMITTIDLVEKYESDLGIVQDMLASFIIQTSALSPIPTRTPSITALPALAPSVEITPTPTPTAAPTPAPSPTPNPTPINPTLSSSITLNDVQLLNEYNLDRGATINRYMGKKLKITGAISNVETQSPPYLDFQTDNNSYFNVRVYVRSASELSTLVKGSRVTFQGNFTGIGMTTLNLDNGTLVTTRPPPQVKVEFSTITKPSTGFFIAKTGFTLLIITLTVTNNGYEEVVVNSDDFYVFVNKIKYGHEYLASDSEFGTVHMLDGNYLSVTEVFQVPIAVTNLGYQFGYSGGSGEYEYKIIDNSTNAVSSSPVILNDFQLLNEYAVDHAGTIYNYLGKKLEITGIVSYVYSKSSPYIDFQAQNGSYNVRVYFQSASQLSTLVKDSTITVQGIFTGFGTSTMNLENGALVSILTIPTPVTITPATPSVPVAVITGGASQFVLGIGDFSSNWTRLESTPTTKAGSLSAYYVYFTEGYLYPSVVINTVAVYANADSAKQVYLGEIPVGVTIDSVKIGDECFVNRSVDVNKRLVFRKNNVIAWIQLMQSPLSDIEPYARIVEGKIR